MYDECFRTGINGGCGFECQVFYDGNCKEPFEFSYSDLIRNDFDKEEIDNILDSYPDYYIEEDDFIEEKEMIL